MNTNPHQVSATVSGIQELDRCLVCGKAIIDNAWFCRFPQKPDGAANSPCRELFICSPWCALRYFGFLDGASQNLEPSRDDNGDSSHIHK
ncbi:MAG TPA: hypothetical protein VGY56_01010 [Verrucomicrobiae bacterium]|nr:hypothetical protein [Verrucomicrobiae bacterium]